MMFVRIFVADLAATFLRLYLPQPLALTHVKSLPWDKQLVLTTVSITLKVINNPFIRDLVFLPSLLLSDRPADEYRPYWGGVASLQSLGTAWGVTWHQGLRRITTRPAYLLLDKIGVPRGTFIYFALHVFICFTLSGLGHMWTILSGGNSGWPTLAFFWLQACGILFEATLYLLSPWSCPVWIKRVWAVAFVAYTAPLFLEDMCVLLFFCCVNLCSSVLTWSGTAGRLAIGHNLTPKQMCCFLCTVSSRGELWTTLKCFRIFDSG